jgi:hypothetical protein
MACFARVLLIAVLVATPLKALQAESNPVVAVFDIKNRAAKISKESLVKLGAYLSTRLAGTGKFKVVPRADIQKKLQKERLASYKERYDQKFQIELGKQVAAQKTVASQLMPIAGKCVLTSNLFDLKQNIAERAGIAEGACDEAGIKRSIDVVAAQLAGTGQLQGRFDMTRGMSKRELVIKLWTERGDSGVYFEGEQLFVLLQANRDCFVRLVYTQVDGSEVQIFPNALTGNYWIRGGLVWPIPGVHDDFEFIVTPPFGAESITAYASTAAFPSPKGTVTESGLKVLSESMDSTYKRAISMRKRKALDTKVSASLTTAPRAR